MLPCRFATPIPRGRFGLSFELLPPRRPDQRPQMWRTVDESMAFEPAMITCTYGAGASDPRHHAGCAAGRALAARDSRGQPSDLRGQFDRRTPRLLSAMALAQGVAAIVALRRRSAQGETAFTPAAGGLRHAAELVALIRSEFPAFGILVAGDPGDPPEAVSPQADLET